MSAFFTALLYAAIAGGVSVAVAGKAYEKHIRYLSALLCTAVLVSPLLSFVLNTDFKAPDIQSDISVDEGAAIDLICRQTAEDMEKKLWDYIFTQKGIKPLQVSIQIESKDKELAVAAVSVRLCKAEEIAAVESLLTQLFGNTVATEVLADEW